MQRAWITGLTLAGVVGTGGAAFAGMSLTHTDGNAVEAQAPAATSATTMSVSTATTYRLGDAGLVTLDSAGGVITVTSVQPSTGWTVLSSSSAAVHVEVSLTDTVQVVQMTADLVDGQIVASLASTASSTTAAPAALAPASAPAPAPASRVVVLVPTPHVKVAATTSASRSTHVTTPSGATRHQSGEHEGGSDD